MKASGKRIKGKRLELKIAELIRAKGLDKNCRRMPMSGAFSHLPEDIFTSLPIHIEAKNQERLQIWAWWNEFQHKVKMGKDPVLVFTSNNRPIMACVNIEYLLNLLKIEQDYLAEVKE